MKQATLLSLIENSSLLFFIYDSQAEVFNYLNPTFKSFFNSIEETMTLALFLDYVHPDDRNYLVERLENVAEEPVDGMDCRFSLSEGERTLRISAYLSDKTSQSQLVGHAEDISATIAHEKVINKHNANKNAILNILSHDLAGPIGVIGNLAEIIKMNAPQISDAKIIAQLDSIHEISKSCIQLIHNFLNQEFLQSVSVPLVKRRLDIVKRFQQFLTQYKFAEDEMGISFDFQTNNPIINLELDEDKFMQVINNLISNSLKFTKKGGRISINITELGDEVRLSIADTGIGIPQKFHADLFEKFSKAKRTGLHGEKSVGLGLWIIKTIIEWHQGTIWFDSEEGVGTTFYISLPKA